MPFNFPLQTKGVDGFRFIKPDAFFLKLRVESERLKNPGFRAPVVECGRCKESAPSSASKPARLYRVARLVLLVAHHITRAK
jgi:hypothetical protein